MLSVTCDVRINAIRNAHVFGVRYYRVDLENVGMG